MKVIIQSVNFASVKVNNKIVGQIKKGILLYLGISNDFNENKLNYFIKKIPKLKIFKNNEKNKNFDLSIKDIQGEILVISQFTLHGIISTNKPNFKNSLNYNDAKEIYNIFIKKLKIESGLNIQTGIFGGNMKVISENNGPINLIIEK